MSIVPSQVKVALLAGGTSGEREISLASAKGAGDALAQAGFSYTQLDPAQRGDLAALLEGDFDIAFLCLHGRGGEDGSIQGLLETIALPYTGSGVWSSATAMDKAKAKVFYREGGIATPQSSTLFRGEQVDVDAIMESLGGHVVVKPGTEGSALGVSICEGGEEIAEAAEKAFAIDEEVVFESFVEGTELTVAVLGNEEPQALPVIQIIPQLGEFYDFESKYAAGGSKHLCPAPLTEEQTSRAQQAAVAAHKALSCRGMSRTDMILDGKGICWVLETNTIPGMTETSLLPEAGRAAGKSFPQLCTELIELALE